MNSNDKYEETLEDAKYRPKHLDKDCLEVLDKYIDRIDCNIGVVVYPNCSEKMPNVFLDRDFLQGLLREFHREFKEIT